jgi:uncharacterized protein (TIGR02145 family)
MKKIYSLVLGLFITVSVFAQAPQKMSYQAVIRKSNNALVQSSSVGIRISILKGSLLGTSVYVEAQTATTNANGLVSLQIGTGTPIIGTFSGINWATGPYFIKTETDPNGGTAYSIVATNELMSVPYALFSANGTPGPQGVAGNNGKTILNGTSNPSAGTGTIGDFYINTTTNTLFGPKTLAGWTSSISLVGPQGLQGPQGPAGGPTGPQGPAGINGTNGIDGISVTNSNVIGDSLFITLSNGQVLNAGYVKGPQGIQGLTGATGPQGPIGLTGTTGATGATGPQGPIGLTGPAGATGATGPQGPIGLTGATGPVGAIGAAGPQGSIGLTGATGAVGPQGPAGLLSNGTTAGNTPYWNGSQWVVNNSNIHNNGTGVGIGTTVPNASAKVEIASTTQGFLPPRMTTVQRDAITSPAAGLTIYNTTVNCLQWWNGTIWYDGCGNNGSTQTVQAQYPIGSVFCASGATAIVDVTNPVTGKTWMDRNLGATQVATSSTDTNAYGDLYQWGRRSDGHQCRTSATTSTLSSVDQPANGNFILASSSSSFDWRSPQNISLWQGVNGVNNPCPSGYRLPTHTELDTERISWSSNNSAGAFASPLKLPSAGTRDRSSGLLLNVGSQGNYSSSTVFGTNISHLSSNASNASMIGSWQAYGFSIRCIKETSIIPATIGSLNCGSSSLTGTLTATSPANSVSVSLPYSTGNGGVYVAQSISSTGVTGLTATLNAGNLANGNGSVLYTITGTPSTSGTATFAISLGGQSCNLTVSVGAATSNINYPTGSVFCASGATAIVDVTNPATGKTWMDRNLGATQVATSSTDTNAYGDLYQWGRRSDGHQCRSSDTTSTLSSSDQPTHNTLIFSNTIPNDWRSPQNNNLWQGVNGINNPCPSGYRLPTEIEWEAERLSWSQSNLTGAFASPLKLPVAGYRAFQDGSYGGVGSIGNYWSSSQNNINSLALGFLSSIAGNGDGRRASGLSVRCIKETSIIPAIIGSLNCGSSSVTGTLTATSPANNVSVSVPYTAGNGGVYVAQSISSTGVTGLTATLNAGNLANGNGSVLYTITGTPSTSGTATFAISLGGQSCNLSVSVGVAISNATYPANSVFCASGATAIVDVTNPATGKTWMDRNLGATQVATSITDVNSYGDLYQWGRRSDGHQCRNSSTTYILSNIDQPLHDFFILEPTNSPFDWRSPQNTNLWQGVNGVNNPCPSGYRLPTNAELDSERLSWSNNNSAGAFTSPLKLPVAGFRDRINGLLSNVGFNGYYWSSSVIGTDTYNLNCYSSLAYMLNSNRVYGFSVRCIKETLITPATIGSLNCGSSSVTGTLTATSPANSVSVGVPYSTGNGGVYVAQSISSTGVTGLTATLNAGNLANGNGSVLYTITGTPSTSGTATFAISLGGQSCNLSVSILPVSPYPAGSVYCTSGATALVVVTNPSTGKIWMDRNLGASQVATSSTDANAYGDLYQWGRRSDGHQCRNSATTTTLSSIDQPSHGSFILAATTTNSQYDWRSPQNINLWQGVNGVNNPCPSGYRLPTNAELDAERLSWSSNNSAGAFASPLKLPMAGFRSESNGYLGSVGSFCHYWSSTVNGTFAFDLSIGSSNSYMNLNNRAIGFSVRCLKN